MKNVSEGTVTVLLAHAPTIYKEAVDKEINLIMVGHTHGGQGFSPRYDYGLSASGVTTMIINAGLNKIRSCNPMTI